MKAVESSLGTPIFVHRVDATQQARRLVWAGLMLVFAFLFLASTKAAAEPTPGYELFYYSSFGVAILLPLIGLLWFLGRFWKARGKSITLHDEGLALVSPGSNRHLRWQEISGLAVRRRFLWQSVIVVEAKSDPIIVEMDYQHPLALANTVLARAAEVVTRQHLAAYARGETTTLGQVALTPTGIQQNGQFLAWSEIQDWQFGLAQILIRKKDDSLGMIISTQIPNAFVLPWLLYAIVDLPLKHEV